LSAAASIGLFGGTFNPVHAGHLAIARDARCLFGLDEVWLVPSASPPHKPPPAGASDADRLEMLRLALDAEGDPALRICDIEFSLPPPSYTLRTVRALRARHPELSFSFVMGADSLLQLHAWHRPLDLLAEIPVLSLARPGVPPPTPDDLRLPPPWPERLLARLAVASLVPASSSAIRGELARTRTSPLVPAPVLRYIRARNLYTGAIP